MKTLFCIILLSFFACAAPNHPEEVSTEFAVVIDGVKESLWEQSHTFVEPVADAKKVGEHWDITSLYITNDSIFLYIGVGVADLAVTTDVFYGIILDINGEAGSGDSGSILGQTAITNHLSGTNHLVDFSIKWDLSSVPELKKWNESGSSWDTVINTGSFFAQGRYFLELKIQLDKVGLNNGDQIFLRVISFEGNISSPAFDVAPVNDNNFNEAQTNGFSSALWNENNDSAMYQIKK